MLERADGTRGRSRRQQARAGSGFPGGHARRRRERRLQRARAGGGADVAGGRADPQHLALSAADPRALFPGLYVGDAGQACGDRRRSRAPVRSALRSAPRVSPDERSAARPRSAGRDRGARCKPSKVSTRTASCDISSTRCTRRSAPISIRSTPTGSPRQLIAIKFASRAFDALPLPKPLLRDFRLLAAA